jgi:hypothetical protein
MAKLLSVNVPVNAPPAALIGMTSGELARDRSALAACGVTAMIPDNNANIPAIATTFFIGKFS